MGERGFVIIQQLLASSSPLQAASCSQPQCWWWCWWCWWWCWWCWWWCWWCCWCRGHVGDSAGLDVFIQVFHASLFSAAHRYQWPLDSTSQINNANSAPCEGGVIVSLPTPVLLHWTTSRETKCVPGIVRELVIDSAVRPSGLHDLVQRAVNSQSNVRQKKKTFYQYSIRQEPFCPRIM